MSLMISCPACQTHFSIEEDAIPAEGRQSHCNKCGHVWLVQPNMATQLADTTAPLNPEEAQPSDDPPPPPPHEQDETAELMATLGLKPATSEEPKDQAEKDTAQQEPQNPPSAVETESTTGVQHPARSQQRIRHPLLIIFLSFGFFLASLYYALIVPCYTDETMLTFDFACTVSQNVFNITLWQELRDILMSF